MNANNLEFLENLYARYLRDPESVEPDWQRLFKVLSEGEATNGRWRFGPTFQSESLFHQRANGRPARADADGDAAAIQERVDQLIRNYRVRGHRIARLDPLGQPAPHPPELNPAYYSITPADMGRLCSTRQMRGPHVRTVGEILASLRETYCRYIGVQFMHIDDLEIREWLQHRMEGTENRLELSRDEQFRIFTRLTDAVVFEEFIQKKFIGAKSFSLEGAESLIPLLDMAIETAGQDGVREIVLGMAHRGRLNVLANIMGKSPREIFREFEDSDPDLHVGRGDVKYHLGYSRNWETAAGDNVHLSLCFNPSHLEFVDPVVVGRTRAKQDRFRDHDRQRALALIIHGDAAFSSEGVVMETLNMSELDGYRVGGTLHIVVNNQIGFTTTPREGRSSVYCTDVAKMLQIPIFHVNGEHPESVAQVLKLALDFRRAFQKDVVIDMYCYRLRGHNEGDEPSFTHPVMYRTIGKRKSVRDSYLKHLLELGGITREEAEQIEDERRQQLEEELKTARSDAFKPRQDISPGVWVGYFGGPEEEAPDVDTSVSRERLTALLESQTRLPDTFHPHAKIARGIEARRKMVSGELALDWAAAESLAFATLATEGYRVRLTGQDSQRGTFSHRHAVLHDVKDGHTYVPLQHLADDQGPVEIYNSSLSEAGVLGFEYGYSLDCPDGLVLWEAQFGDFVNAAQVIIDQFIASAEDKWRRLSGLVLLLPHGFEGQGPEHSSARLERFLILAAEDNIQIVVPSTAAQYFHCLRRQVLSPWRKPLVVMTPKSLLRLKEAASSWDDFEKSSFQPVIGGHVDGVAGKIERVLLCSGKIYYELQLMREKLERQDVDIIRLEQLYPFPHDELQSALSGYPDSTRAIWVQEEPENAGARRYLHNMFCDRLYRLPFAYVSRPASASPATGSKTAHTMEQNRLLEQAFGGP